MLDWLASVPHLLLRLVRVVALVGGCLVPWLLLMWWLHRRDQRRLVARLRALQAQGLTLQAIANQLNAEGEPTLTHKGRWQKGTVGNLLAEEG